MRLGSVLKKEREAQGLSTAEVSSRLAIPESDYIEIEQGRSPAEKWGPILARIAIQLEIPTSRLISASGRAVDAKVGECGSRIRTCRQKSGQSPEVLAKSLELSLADYAEIEAGGSPIEICGPLLLHFAELIQQPIFNLFYPCGIALEKLEDYP